MFCGDKTRASRSESSLGVMVEPLNSSTRAERTVSHRGPPRSILEYLSTWVLEFIFVVAHLPLRWCLGQQQIQHRKGSTQLPAIVCNDRCPIWTLSELQ